MEIFSKSSSLSFISILRSVSSSSCASVESICKENKTNKRNQKTKEVVFTGLLKSLKNVQKEGERKITREYLNTIKYEEQ